MAQCRLEAEAERGRQRLGVASLYKIMCFALRRHYGTSVWRMWLLLLPFFSLLLLLLLPHAAAAAAAAAICHTARIRDFLTLRAKWR